MWHLIIRKHSGEIVREESQDKPSVHEIGYWEEYHSQYITSPSKAYYDTGTKELAVVVNIFESED